MISGLIWNIYGMGGIASMQRLKKLIRLHSLVFVAIIEPFVFVDRLEEFQQRLGFPNLFVSPNNKIWLFSTNALSVVSITTA